GVGRDDHFAIGQREIHLPDQFDDLGHRIQVPNVDEKVLATAVHQVHVAPDAASRLDIHLDDAILLKCVAALQHPDTISPEVPQPPENLESFGAFVIGSGGYLSAAWVSRQDAASSVSGKYSWQLV